MSICQNCVANCPYTKTNAICKDFKSRNIQNDTYGHYAVANEIGELLNKKRADYGAENIKKFGSRGVLVRVSDKAERLINLGRKDGQAHFESVEDTWKDIAGYAILALIELREGR